MVLPTPLLGLGSFGQRASKHSGWAMRGSSTAPKPPFPWELNNGRWGGHKIILDHWMDELRSDGGRSTEMAGS